MRMWDSLTEFTKELFGMDVVSSDLPEGVQHANRVQFLGAGVSWQEATRTAVVNLDGSGTPIGLVTDAAPGLVNEYPDGLLRLCSSNGTTDGATWLVCSKTLLDSAIADHAIGLPKLHAGGASTGNRMVFDGASWGPGDDNTIDIEAGTGISVDWTGNTATIACTLSIPSVPTYVAGAGMTSSGTTFNVIAENGSIVVNADNLRVGFDATVPLANGVAAHGDSVYAAAANHVHPAGAESVVYHPSCRVACVSNVTIATPGAVHRGLTLTGTGTDRLLLLGQSNPAENGIYVWNGPGTAMGRAADWTGTIDLSVTHCIPCFRASDTVDDDGPNISDRSGMWFTTSSVASFVVGTDAMAGRFLSPEKNVLHEPCECATTRNIDLHTLEIPYRLSGSQLSAFDTAGYTLQDDDRVFLAHQTDPLEDGPWTIQPDSFGESSISRPDDWKTGSVIRAHTVHEFPIKRGMSGPVKWFACKATDALIGDTVVGTGIACDWFCYGAGAGSSVTIWHPPAFIHGTKNYDTTAFPAAVEGQTIVSSDKRIVLTKQLNARENGIWATDVDNEDGTWTLTRVSDWPEGAIIEAGTVHYINVEYGELRPPHLVIFHVQTDTLIWGGSMTTGSFAISTSLIPEHDVIDTVVAIDEAFEYTPPGADADHRFSVRLSGVVEMLDDYTPGIFAGTSKSIPLDVDPRHSWEDEEAFDDLDEIWGVHSSSSVVYRDTTTKTQGASSWRIETPSGAGTPYSTGLTKRFALPSGQVGRFTAKVLKSSDWSAGNLNARLGVATDLLDTIDHMYPTELGYLTITSTSTWTSVVFDVPATNTTRMLQFSLFGNNYTTSTATRKVGWIDAVQIAKTVSSDFATRVIVDAEYGPGSLVDAIYYADDTQGTQVIDADAQLGGTRLCLFDMSGSNVLTLNSLSVARSVRLTVGLFPAAPSASAPALPATPTLPAYPY